MSEDQGTPGAFEDTPTDNHDLAQDQDQVEPEEHALVHTSSNRKLLDIKWKPSSRTVEETLAPGLSNEDLWLLIRRFNKVCLPAPVLVTII